MKPHAVKTDRVSYNLDEVYTNSNGFQYEVMSLNVAKARKLVQVISLNAKPESYVLYGWHNKRPVAFYDDKASALATLKVLCNDWRNG